MHAGIGEVSAASNHAFTIDDDKLVVHQATALASVFGVINPSNLSVLKDEERIALSFFFWTHNTVLILIGLNFQALLSFAPMTAEIELMLLAPGSAVGIFYNHFHVHALA